MGQRTVPCPTAVSPVGSGQSYDCGLNINALGAGDYAGIGEVMLVMPRALAALAGSAYLKSKGYTLSRQLYIHALYGDGASLSEKTNDLMIDSIKKSVQLSQKLNELILDADNNIIDRTETVEFSIYDDPDLYYSVQHITLSFSGTKEGDTWHFKISGVDLYDFDTLRLLHDGLSIGNAANDMGWFMQRTGVMTTYGIWVDFEMEYSGGHK